ncbi:MAG TPA: VOC family protein [Hyphomonadaceae bacterium]|nr:VOC family protein [Hyphomonadaceae bacterium]
MRGQVHHVDLSIRDIAKAEPLYDLVLTHIGYVKGKPYPDGGGEWDLADGTSIGIRPSSGANAQRDHDRYSSGLHHLAWSATSRDDVDALFGKLTDFGATILDPPADYPQYNGDKGYYAVFFADPDGLKLEYVWTP